MPSLEIHAFSDEFREDAARLLAERHARERAAEPLLPEVDDYAAQIPDGEGLVATRGGAAVAYRRPAGDLRVPEQNIDLAHAATLDEVRGQGAGLALTAHVLGWAHEHGFRSMTVDWRSVNLLASRFWPRRGWRPTHYRLYRAMP